MDQEAMEDQEDTVSEKAQEVMIQKDIVAHQKEETQEAKIQEGTVLIKDPDSEGITVDKSKYYKLKEIPD